MSTHFNPQHAQANLDERIQLRKQGQLDTALETFQHALEVNPKLAVALPTKKVEVYTPRPITSRLGIDYG